jgi:hypothetical protein
MAPREAFFRRRLKLPTCMPPPARLLQHAWDRPGDTAGLLTRGRKRVVVALVWLGVTL